MKAFQFTLQAVQTLRHRQEQQAMETYVHALLARQQVLDRLETVRDQIRRNQREMNRLLLSATAASPLAQASQYERALEDQQAQHVVALALAERRVQNTFQAMLTARQRRKIVENLRVKQHAHHQRAEWREEQKLLDDLASRRGRPILAWKPEEAAL
ncbi:MAG: flagellar export protein FliJ [Verrucomicrobiota bacterium]|jgi:flagellar export protein FliJ